MKRLAQLGNGWSSNSTTNWRGFCEQREEERREEKSGEEKRREEKKKREEKKMKRREETRREGMRTETKGKDDQKRKAAVGGWLFQHATQGERGRKTLLSEGKESESKRLKRTGDRLSFSGEYSIAHETQSRDRKS